MRGEHLPGLIPALAVLALAASAAASEVTWQDRRPDTVQATVSYADLDLRSAAGREALGRRIRDVAHRLCWQVWDTPRLADFSTCLTAALDDARQQVRQAEMAAKTGRLSGNGADIRVRAPTGFDG